MTTECRLSVRAIMLAFISASLFACPGCPKEEPTFEIVPLEGKIEKIDRTSDETGEITVSYYSEKQKQDVVGTGQVARETEIMINGAAAKLGDLREGERIRGEVRIDKKGKERTQTALKIYVDRPTPVGGEGD